ncbi:MAG: DUF3276 family protein [Flavobacteriales bacterium]|nr:DUF3276 family protein [Flavobacteriales bacterium]
MEGDKDHYDKEEIYSKVIRAGKRTYFFDVKSTRGNDLYLTVTESKKRFNDNGDSFYEKHKIFLYKEDFEKFQEGLEDVLGEIERLKEDDPKYRVEESKEEKDSEEKDESYTKTKW